MRRHAFVHPDDVLLHPPRQKHDAGGPVVDDAGNPVMETVARFADPDKGEAVQRIVIYASHPHEQACSGGCVPPADRSAWLAAHPDALIE